MPEPSTRDLTNDLTRREDTSTSQTAHGPHDSNIAAGQNFTLDLTHATAPDLTFSSPSIEGESVSGSTHGPLMRPNQPPPPTSSTDPRLTTIRARKDARRRERAEFAAARAAGIARRHAAKLRHLAERVNGGVDIES